MFDDINQQIATHRARVLARVDFFSKHLNAFEIEVKVVDTGDCGYIYIPGKEKPDYTLTRDVSHYIYD